MQDFQQMQELSDEDLEMVSGGKHNPPAWTNTGVSVTAGAGGGKLGIDKVITKTESITIDVNGESVSASFGIALAFAF